MHYRRQTPGPLSILVYIGIILIGMYYTKYSTGNTLVDLLVIIGIFAGIGLIAYFVKRAGKQNRK